MNSMLHPPTKRTALMLATALAFSFGGAALAEDCPWSQRATTVDYLAASIAPMSTIATTQTMFDAAEVMRARADDYIVMSQKVVDPGQGDSYFTAQVETDARVMTTDELIAGSLVGPDELIDWTQLVILGNMEVDQFGPVRVTTNGAAMTFGEIVEPADHYLRRAMRAVDDDTKLEVGGLQATVAS